MVDDWNNGIEFRMVNRIGEGLSPLVHSVDRAHPNVAATRGLMMGKSGDAEPGSGLAAVAARRLQPLGFRARLNILLRLDEAGELNVSQIADTAGTSQPTVSHHLSALKHAGWVNSERRGRQTVYALADGDALRRLLAVLLEPEPGEPSGGIRR